jgi:hypothetical protein
VSALYCVACGAEVGVDDCDHGPDAEGPYCHTCGVIPTEGGECKFYKPNGNETGCKETR